MAGIALGGYGGFTPYTPNGAPAKPGSSDPFASAYQGDRAGGFGAPPISSPAQNYDTSSPYGQGSNSAGAAGGANSTASKNAQATNSDYSIDPYGNTQYSNSTASQNNAARLQAEAEARRMAAIKGLFGQYGGNMSPHVGGGMGADESAARAAAFARAKDQSAGTFRGATDALHSLAASGGYAGSGREAAQEQQFLGGSAMSLDDFTRDQLMTDLNRSSAIGDRNYAGNITQRGQDMSQLPAIFGLLSSRALY